MRVAMCFFFLMIRRPPRSTLFPTRRSSDLEVTAGPSARSSTRTATPPARNPHATVSPVGPAPTTTTPPPQALFTRSEEHTSELQSRQYLVCRLLLEKKKNQHPYHDIYSILY